MTTAKKAERTLQQVKMPDDLHRSIKLQAVQQDVLMQEVFDEAMQKLIADRKKQKIQYLASPREGKSRSFWLLNSILAEVQATAESDDVPVNRVEYTALVRFFE
jgi:hypothetical protein